MRMCFGVFYIGVKILIGFRYRSFLGVVVVVYKLLRRSFIPSGRFIWKSCYYLEILLAHGLLINFSYYFLYPDHAITPYSTENTSEKPCRAFE